LPAPAGAGANAEFMDGVVASRDLGALNLLNLPRVLHAARQRAVAR
jgi:hypothetical protein